MLEYFHEEDLRKYRPKHRTHIVFYLEQAQVDHLLTLQRALRLFRWLRPKSIVTKQWLKEIARREWRREEFGSQPRNYFRTSLLSQEIRIALTPRHRVNDCLCTTIAHLWCHIVQLGKDWDHTRQPEPYVDCRTLIIYLFP